MTASVSVISASSASTRSRSRCAASILASPVGEAVGLLAVGQLVDDPAGALDARLAGLDGRARRIGRGLGRFLDFGGGGQFLHGLSRRSLQLGDRGRPLVDVGTQSASVIHRLSRCGLAGLGRGGNQLGLLEPAGQFADFLRSRARRREPGRGFGAFGGQQRRGRR